MSEKVDTDAIVNGFDPFRDTSPVHIHDGHGAFCGKKHSEFTRGVDWRDVDQYKMLVSDTCAPCLAAWRYMKERT